MPYVGNKSTTFNTFSATDVKVTDDLTVTDDATIGGALSAKGGAVFNEDSADVDFRVESNGNANMLFVDGGNDRVGIGTNSPTSGSSLEVRGSASNGQIYLGGSTSGTYGKIYSDNDGVLVLGADAANNSASSSFSVEVDGTQRMQIDASGNATITNSVGVNGATGYPVLQNGQANASFPSYTFFGDGNTGMLRPSADALAFATGGTERMRIDASGLVHVGRTAAASNASGVTLQPNGQSQFVTMGNDVKAMAVGSGNDVQLTVIEFLSGGNVTGSVSVTSNATAFNTSSDVRLKENIEDAKSSGSIIDQIQVREFDWKKSGEHQRHGMIAQELNEVAPEAVTTDEVHKGDMWSVDYSKLVPMMLKEIQDLRKRLTALEA